MLSKYTQRHSYHLVDPSIMPLLSSMSCLTTALGAVLYFHGYVDGFQIQMLGCFLSLLVWAFDEEMLLEREL
jgi:cytochrome c oxidase subunit 3